MAQAITIETAVTESYSASSPTSPVTMSMTVPAGLSNAILIVQLGFAHNSMTLGTPTYNGGNMTLGRTDDQSTTTKNSIWYTLNPASGTNTISVPWTGTVTQSHIGAIVIANAVQAAPLVGGNNGSLQSTATCNTTITGQSYLIIDGITPNATITAASAQTVLLNTTSTFVRAAMSYRFAPKLDIYAMTWTGTNVTYAQTAVAFQSIGTTKPFGNIIHLRPFAPGIAR